MIEILSFKTWEEIKRNYGMINNCYYWNSNSMELELKIVNLINITL